MGKTMPESGPEQPQMTPEQRGVAGVPIEEAQVARALREARAQMRGGNQGPMREFLEEHPLSGGSPWLYGRKEDLRGLSPRLRDLITETETTPPNLWDAQRLTDRYFEVQKAARRLKEGTPRHRIAEDVLIKILDRIQELSKAEAAGTSTGAALEKFMEVLTKSPTEQARERVGRDIKGNAFGATGVLREHLFRIEARGVPFGQAENQQDWTEFNALLDLYPQLRSEFEARQSLHNTDFVFATAPDIKTARNAVNMSAGALKRLFQVPGVAEALRQYERMARTEQDAYKALQQGKGGKTLSIQPELKLVTADGDEVDRARTRIATSKEVVEAVEANLGRRRLGKRLLNIYTESAQRLAERIWQITGRSSYWNQFMEAPVKPPQMRAPREYMGVTFDKGVGRGGLSGYHFIGEKIFGLNSRLKRSVPGALELWFEKQPGPDGVKVDLWDTRARDFWTEKGRKLGLRDNKGELVNPDPQIGFLESLESVRFEDERVDWSDSPMLISWINDMVKADAVREEALEERVGSFLQTASPAKFWELASFYKHLNLTERDKVFGALLLTMIRLYRPTGVGQRAPIQRYYPEAKVWPRDFVERVVKNAAQSGGMITRETAAKILKQTLGGPVQRVVRREAKNVGGDVAAGLWAGVKAVIGLK